MPSSEGCGARFGLRSEAGEDSGKRSRAALLDSVRLGECMEMASSFQMEFVEKSEPERMRRPELEVALSISSESCAVSDAWPKSAIAEKSKGAGWLGEHEASEAAGP